MKPAVGRVRELATAKWSRPFFAAIPVVCSALLGCESTEGEPDDTDTISANVVLVDESNYTAQGSLAIDTVETVVGDLDICWSGLVEDLQCHDVAPQTDIDNVAMLRFLHLSEEDVEVRLAGSQLAQSEVDGYLAYETNHQSVCTKLSEMTFLGTPVDISEEYTESIDQTYMLLFAKGTTPGVGARTMIFVKPTANSSITMVEAPTGCGLLDFTADLQSATPVAVPAAGPWIFGWRDITRDSQGNGVAFESIDGALLGFYEGMTLADIEAQIFDLEIMATSLWEITLTGKRTTDLALAVNRQTGEFFSGFDVGAEGVWLFALMCSTCQNPAPIVLAVLSPTT